MKYFFLSLTIIFIFFTFSSVVSAATIFQAPTALGLVGYWDFNEGSGTTAEDKSGQSSNAVLTNMNDADWVDGKIESGVYLDDSNDLVVLPETGSLPTLADGSFSLSAWAKVTDSTHFRNIVRRDNYINQGAEVRMATTLLVNFSTGYAQFGIYDGTSSGNATGAVDRADGLWHHFAGVYDAGGENTYIYVDGALEGSNLDVSAVGPFNTAREPWVVGSVNTTSFVNDDMLGTVDEVRMYDRALSASEITNLYNSQKKAFPTVSKPTLSDGLVGYWNFDFNKGGSTVYDMSTGTNNGTMTNMDPSTDWVDGKIGSGAMDLDGSDDYMSIPDSTDLEFGTNDFSINFWFLADSSIATLKGGISKGAYASSFAILPQSNRLEFYASSNGSTYDIANIQVFGSISLDTWYNVTLIRSSGVIKGYLDGVNGFTVNNGTAFNDNSEALTLGYYSSGGGYYLDGQIDDVRIYNRALSQDEVTRLYKATAGTKVSSGLSKGLVGHWDLDDESGTTAIDKSGNQNNGTLVTMDDTDWVAGKIGTTSLDFDGSSDYISTVTNLWSANGNHTLSAWVNVDVAPIGYGAGVFDTSGQGDISIQDDLQVRVHPVGANWEDTVSSITLNAWHHIAVTQTASARDIYIDGVFAPTTDDSGSANTIAWDTPTALARFGIDGVFREFFNGQIDDVRLYNRALSADEIYRLYKLR